MENQTFLSRLQSVCDRIRSARWFKICTWVAMLTCLILVCINVFIAPDGREQLHTNAQEGLVSEYIFDIVQYISCSWFTFEMIVRILADGRRFFRSRRNLFDLTMSAATFLPKLTVFGAFRLLGGMFVDNIEAPMRDRRSGTMR